MAKRRPWTLSPAALHLLTLGGPSHTRIAELTGIPRSIVSRSLRGEGPLRPEVLAVIEEIHGSAVAAEVAELALKARTERLARKGSRGPAARTWPRKAVGRASA